MRLSQILSFFLLLAACAAEAQAAAPSTEPGAEVYRVRRERLMSTLPKGALVIMHAPPTVEDNNLFRPDSNFWYMTGMAESDTVAQLVADAPPGKRYTLFVQTKDWAKEQWTGYRAGPELAKSQLGAEQASALEEFNKQLLESMRDASSLWLYDGGDSKFRDEVISTWNRRALNSTVALPVYNLAPAIAELRLYKDATEVALLREAAELSVQAHLAALPLARVGRGEWHLRAAMVATCLNGAAARLAYPSIVGSGKNSVVLHYEADSQVLKKGDMIVNDTACEYGMYAADVTRSYPVGGVFSAEQKIIYNIVLKSQHAGEQASRLGATMQQVYDATVDVIVDGLLELGIMKGSKAEIIATRSFRKFYPHGSSHWIGLDVHDAGSYEQARIPKDAPPHLSKYAPPQARLKPGMAFTIEPGIYIPEKSEGVDPKWWNIGVRIEDDYLMNDKGVECLSCALPRTIPELEKRMAGSR